VFGDTIKNFAVPGGVTIRRGSAGTSVKGRFTPGATTDTPGVVASVQPITGKELERLPEGIRSKRPAKLYTETEIKQADVGASTPPDQILWDSETWEVHNVGVHTWGSYYKAIIFKVGQ
jgi:hypothetical protein